MFVKYLKAVCFYLGFLLIWCRPAISYTVITSLPGFNASLPSKLETGYIGVDDTELFYYFIESERNPAEDPVLLWLTGGPGCSSVSALFFEVGPLRFNMVEYNGSLPTFHRNPYAWTKVASIIFLEAPVGTGFSYSKTPQGFKTGDMKHAISCYKFLKKWLERHPKFITNPLYISGSSYSGLVVPIITRAISDDIEDTGVTVFNLKGYVLGNPLTDKKIDINARIPYYNRMALISDELYESAKRNCKGEYTEVEVGNKRCARDLQAISECTEHIYLKHILEPKCPSEFSEVDVMENNRKYLLETYELSLPRFGCRNYNTYLLKFWANDVNVLKTLNVRMGTIKEWFRCNLSLDFDNDVQSVVSYHQSLNTKGYRALIYSGDHDAGFPFSGTESWIKSLNLSITDDWRPWFVDGQVGGYTREYDYKFTFATVKGSGHTVPEFNPKESFAIFSRWISQQPL